MNVQRSQDWQLIFHFSPQHAFFHMSVEYNTCGYMVQQIWKSDWKDYSDILAEESFDRIFVVGQE